MPEVKVEIVRSAVDAFNAWGREELSTGAYAIEFFRHRADALEAAGLSE